MQNYLFTKCLHPRGIYNPYTREWVAVPCGHCKACLLNKSAYYKQLTTLEALSNRCTYFVTLTYANQYLPKCYPVRNEGTYTSSIVDADTGEILNTVFNTDLPPKLFDQLRSDYIPYLSIRHIQLFLKRLRKLYAKSRNTLRYFAVGEYGPAHFRPHYHLLLWFEKPTTCARLEENIFETWKYGRIDVQKAKGDAARYVTGYANSFSFIPPVLQAFKQAKPFCLHSIKLGEKNLPYSYEEILFNDPETTSTVCFSDGERIKEFRLWRSYISRHVPRCIGYASKNASRRYQSYCIYAEAKEFISHTSTYDLAEQIFDYVNKANYKDELRSKHSVVYNYFKSLFPNPNWYLHYTQKDKVEKIINRIYRELLISRRFCTIADTINIDDGKSVFSQFSSKYDALFYYIQRYYSRKELNTLNNFYTKLEKFSKEHENEIKTDNLYYYIYHPCHEEKIIGTKLYNIFSSETDVNFNNSVKHKKQNDLNNLLYHPKFSDYGKFNATVTTS